MIRRYFIALLLVIPTICSIFITKASGAVPTPDHVVIVFLENHAYNSIVGSPAAPYINSLIADNKAALFTQSYALSHPSQPNYIQFFSGSNQGVTNNNVPAGVPFTTPNLGASLLTASKTFVGYSEDLPYVGFTGATSGLYASKHSPWVHWQGSPTNGIPANLNRPFTDFPSNYSTLPHVAFVTPNLESDMHNGSNPGAITVGDTWLQNNFDGYVQWAKTHNSLLIITFDEDDNASQQRIMTLFIGQQVLHGSYSNHIDHYNVLHMLEDMYGLPHIGASAFATTIDYCWDVCSTPATISPAGPFSFCQGSSVMLTASSGSSYQWSNGATTQSINVTNSGNYSVTITGGSGCTNTSSPVSVSISSFGPGGAIFNETMGTVAATTTISVHESNNGFDNDNYTMSGTGDVRITTASSGYSGASGGGNVFLTNTPGKSFIISGINTIGVTNPVLSFGIYKSRILSTGADFIVSVSSDGITYSPLTFPALPTGNGTAIWNYRSTSGNIPSTSNLRIQFMQTDTVTQYRIDDVSINYSTSAAVISASGPTTFCQGGSVTLSSTYANSYSWSNGATTQSINANSTGNYFVIGTLSSGCALTSNTIPVIVNANITPSVTISTNSSHTICSGTSVTFSATPVNGGGSPSYQWKKNGVNVGTNSSSYTSNSIANNSTITCTITNTQSCSSTNSAVSNSITMTVNSTVTPSVSISAANGNSICAGDMVTFTAVPSQAGASPVYQWKVNGVTVGSNSNTYSDNSFLDGDVVTCELTSSALCATISTAVSNSITIDISLNYTPSISIVANTGNSICSGTLVAFTATVAFSGTSPFYQWKKNGTNVGINSYAYTDNTLINGDVITCTMTSNLSCASPASVSSNSVAVVVNANVIPSISISSNTGNTICEGTHTTFTALPAFGGGDPVYQWKKNGTVVGADSIIYNDSTLANGDVIICVLTSDLSCASPLNATSNTVTMTVNANVIPSVSISASPGLTICQGTNVTFTATPGNGGPTPIYQWVKNLINVGTNSSTYSANNLSNGDVVSLNMTSNAACVNENPGTSNDLLLTVNPLTSILNFSPASGNVGSVITINGTNFTSLTSVSVNGINATFSIINSSQITAVVPAGATTGLISVTNNCGTANSLSTFVVNGTSVILNLKLFIEGYYLGAGQMNAAISPGISDSVTVELHNNVSPYAIAFTGKGMISTIGNGTYNFPLAVNGNSYYIVVFSHNTLKTWSSIAVPFTTNTTYDFSTSASMAFGNNLKNLNDGNFAIYSGDVTQNDQIDIDDFNEIKNNTQVFPSGYSKYDLTGDGAVESTDFSLVENNKIPLITLHP